MKICPDCGEQYSDEFLFCKADGADLVPQEHMEALNDPEPTERKTEPKAASGTRFLGIGVLAVIAVIGLSAIRSSTTASAPQATPTPAALGDVEQEVEAEGEPAPTATPEASFPGEVFPQTRRYALPQGEIERLGYSKVLYAINEIYARRGFPFDNGPIRRHFDTMSWYRPQEGKSMESIEATDMPRLEMENARNLAAWKQVLASRGLSEK